MQGWHAGVVQRAISGSITSAAIGANWFPRRLLPVPPTAASLAAAAASAFFLARLTGAK